MPTDPIILRMQERIDAWERNNDRRAIFLTCYKMMTENMFAAVDAEEFNDGVWVRNLLHRFAEYYFAGLNAYEQNSPDTPAAWRVAHDEAKNDKVMTLQHLFLGINAHINYDLALTLVDVLENDWPQLPQPLRRERYQDHCHVNDIIAATIDAVQDGVVERFTPSLDIVDKVFGRADEWALSRIVSRWREEVWVNAESLLNLSPALERKHAVVGLIQAMALERADAVLLKNGLKGLRKLL